MDILSEIRRIISLESEALIRLRDRVDESFARAVHILFACTGKILVTGVGKSGIVARKIASIFASTGSPAFFLHPADAAHGDIGVVRPNDVIIVVSKSGESDELNALLPTFRRSGAQILAISTGDRSTLSRSADVTLMTWAEQEACPFNVAPTCSSTAAVAVGDALALSVMQLRGLGAADFALHHPGGRIGKRLLLSVGDIMRQGKANPVVPLTATVSEMLCEMTAKQSGAVCVVGDSNCLAGLVTDYDVRRLLERGADIFAINVTEMMNPTPITISPDAKAQTALELMEKREKPLLVLPVVDGERRVVGLLHLHDIVALGL